MNEDEREALSLRSHIHTADRELKSAVDRIEHLSISLESMEVTARRITASYVQQLADLDELSTIQRRRETLREEIKKAECKAAHVAGPPE